MALLSRFFVFDDSLGKQEDNQHEKILYFYPASTAFGDQLTQVGLMEALTKFSSTFSRTELCDTVTTDKYKYFLLNPEDSIWMVMVFQPYVSPSSRPSASPPNGEALLPSSLRAVLLKMYNLFKFLYGSFADNIANHGVNDLRLLLDQFYEYSLPGLNLRNFDVLHALNGIEATTPRDVLGVQYGVNVFLTGSPEVSHCMLLVDDNLAWSDMPVDDLMLVYEYYRVVLGPSMASKPVPKFSARWSSPAETLELVLHEVIGSLRRSIVKDVPAKDADFLFEKAPLVFLGHRAHNLHRLVVFRFQRLLLLLLARPNLSPESLESLTSTAAVELPRLVSCCPKAAPPPASKRDENCTFAFVDTSSALLNSTMRNRKTPLSAEQSRILDKMRQQFHMSTQGLREVCVKTKSDVWVMGVKSASRELFMLIDQKSADLVQVNEDVIRLTAMHFNNVFLDTHPPPPSHAATRPS